MFPFQSPSFLMNDGSPYMGGRGDPNVAWTGRPGQFVYVSLAESNTSFGGENGAPPDNPVDVIAAVSNDGAMTFGPAVGTGKFGLVSDHQSSAMDTAGGTVDQPSLAVEQPSTHVAWVSWDNINVPFNGGGKRPWIRRLHFQPDGTINFGPVTEVRIDCNLSCVKLDSQNIAATCDPAHASIDDCAGGTETLVITFPRVNNSPINDTALIDNQGAMTCSSNLDVEWRTAISVDGGVTWTQGVGQSDGSTIMGEDTNWPNCIVPAAMANAGNNRGRMAIVHDDNLVLWHAFWTKETFNGPGGTATGQRVFHTVFDDTFSGMVSEEIDPVFNIAGVACGSPPIECVADQFMPSAAFTPGPGANTTIAASWHDTRRDAATPRGTIWGTFSKVGGTPTGTFFGNDLELAQGAAGIPWFFSGTNGNTPWGDYEGMASDRAGTFFPAYGDNRLGGTDTHVTVRGWMP
jgi:hypothetical protein